MRIVFTFVKHLQSCYYFICWSALSFILQEENNDEMGLESNLHMN